MNVAIWFGVYLSPFILIIQGLYIGYVLWRFIHRMDDKDSDGSQIPHA